MRNLSIRNVPDELHGAIKREAGLRRRSLNQTVVELLKERLGVASARSNGLRRLAGTWTEEELREFIRVEASQEHVDPELWSE